MSVTISEATMEEVRRHSEASPPVEPTVYRADKPRERRREYVLLPDGKRFMWAWEMDVSCSTQILERSERPQMAGGGHSAGKGIVMQIMLSCYESDKPDARPIFTDADFTPIYAIPFGDFDVIYAAINRVNGKAATEQERLRDFLTVQQEPNSS